jgi:hypothetical protein
MTGACGGLCRVHTTPPRPEGLRPGPRHLIPTARPHTQARRDAGRDAGLHGDHAVDLPCDWLHERPVDLPVRSEAAHNGGRRTDRVPRPLLHAGLPPLPHRPLVLGQPHRRCLRHELLVHRRRRLPPLPCALYHRHEAWLPPPPPSPPRPPRVPAPRDGPVLAATPATRPCFQTSCCQNTWERRAPSWPAGLGLQPRAHRVAASRI